MGIVLNRHVLSQNLVTAATDRVISHAQIPSECALINVWGETHIIASAPMSSQFAMVYGMDGFVVSDTDPGGIDTINDIWDFRVTKDDDFSGGLDIDSFDSDPNPVYEPGEPNISNLMGLDVNESDKRFYKRRKMVTFANSKGGFIDGTPDLYLPTDLARVRSRKRVVTELQSYAMIGVSAPAMDDVTVTSPSTFGTEAAWMGIKYVNIILEQAFIDLVGLTEAGAETPWEDAALLLEDYLEPTVIEQTAGSFNATTINQMSMHTFQVWVPGSHSISQITAS